MRLVDLFSGPVALDANGEAEISLPVPDFNGSLRLMAVAAAGERASTACRRPRSPSPRRWWPNSRRRAFSPVGDSALLALDLHNLAGAAQEVKVRVSNDDGLLIKNGEQKVSLKDQEKRVLRVPLEAGSALGLTEVTVRIDSALSKIERRFPLQVQAPTPRQSVLRRRAGPGETVEIRRPTFQASCRRRCWARWPCPTRHRSTCAAPCAAC